MSPVCRSWSAALPRPAALPAAPPRRKCPRHPNKLSSIKGFLIKIFVLKEVQAARFRWSVCLPPTRKSSRTLCWTGDRTGDAGLPAGTLSCRRPSHPREAAAGARVGRAGPRPAPPAPEPKHSIVYQCKWNSFGNNSFFYCFLSTVRIFCNILNLNVSFDQICSLAF